MSPAIRPVGHEEKLTLVDHLDELRRRLMISGAVLAVAFGICLWQNNALLSIMNKPLVKQTQKQVEKGQGTVGQAVVAQQAVLKVAADTRAALAILARPVSGLPAATRAQLVAPMAALRRDTAQIPRTPPGDKPVTLGVGEPFTTTITVSLYFALVLALPVILYELYGFIVPALNPVERRLAKPLLIAVPFLFVIGVSFGYFVVLPAAVRFFVNFNSEQFNILVQASTYYTFAATILLAMGFVFQVPVAILGATRVGLVTPRQLRKNRKYAIVACAAIAALLPGDAITLLLETVPLYVLFEASILLATLAARADARAARRDGLGAEGAGPAGQDPARQSKEPEPTVQQIIDHVDKDLSD
jgi:sec-independent protein translocase protein TatC